MPKTRSEDLRSDHGEWAGERWGASGRPVLLLNPAEDDRSAWWPVAARLVDLGAVSVLDLPEGRTVADQAESLALLAARAGARAPVLAGHGRAALVATVFAVRYVAHAVVNVGQRLDVPEAAEAGGRLECRYLSVFSAEPRPGYEAWLRVRVPGGEYEEYGTGDAHPHLGSPGRFAADLRRVAC
ncbi:alpha/beta fold hydrolase [Glycomyces paridis]|uniref:Alpha/beta hydrolase n=1 Tax=Glycomyces paridis TaxID=2126555 RepID=A0A4S8PC12_9ACTN|nr:hypothetical protein [Glycomyces paridis]THV27251.1 hypothetical protein E9998_15440 [Glycomyces paridis]